MTACRACCAALKANAVEVKPDAKELVRLNQILDSIEGNGDVSAACIKAHVHAVRALLRDAATLKTSIDTVRRSEHCNHCRWMLKQHIPSLAKDDDNPCDLLTLASLKTLVDWSCSTAGEELRASDPAKYDDILASFAWCAREQLLLVAGQSQTNADERSLRKVSIML